MRFVLLLNLLAFLSFQSLAYETTNICKLSDTERLSALHEVKDILLHNIDNGLLDSEAFEVLFDELNLELPRAISEDSIYFGNFDSTSKDVKLNASCNQKTPIKGERICSVGLYGYASGCFTFRIILANEE